MRETWKAGVALRRWRRQTAPSLSSELVIVQLLCIRRVQFRSVAEYVETLPRGARSPPQLFREGLHVRLGLLGLWFFCSELARTETIFQAI